MAVIKCKMCGGDLNISEGITVAECEYCGSKQTIPNQDSAKKLDLFSRADRLRWACEFDKAADIYESIVAEFPEEAEAYWGLALCRYGIEYVDDPATGKKVPTCHSPSFDSILEDTDFEQACENADAIARQIYRDEAKQAEKVAKEAAERAAAEKVKADARIAAEKAAREAAEKKAAAAKKRAELAARGSKMKPIYAEHRKRIALAAKRISVPATLTNIFGLDMNGTVLAANSIKDQHVLWDWKDIVAITATAEGRSVLGLKSNGTVVTAGDSGSFQSICSCWKDIVAITAASNYIVGLKADGTVIAYGNYEFGKCNVGNWADVVAIAVGGRHTVGLKSDGTVVAVGDNGDGQCNVSDWTDIVAIAAGGFNTIGLKADGMVVAAGRSYDGQSNINDWTDIVAIASGYSHAIGLKLDGTVVAVGNDARGQCGVDNWTDIVAVAAGDYITVGVKSDGTVVKTPINSTWKNDWAKGWKLFDSIDTLEQEIVQASKRRHQAEREKAEREEAQKEQKRREQLEKDRQLKERTARGKRVRILSLLIPILIHIGILWISWGNPENFVAYFCVGGIALIFWIMFWMGNIM